MKLVKGKNNYFIMLTAFWLLTITAVCLTAAHTMRYDRPRWREVNVILSGYAGLFPAGFPQRSYTRISLRGNEAVDDAKLDFAGMRIGEILREMDTVRGVHFFFEEGARYKTLIRVMDILRQERAQHYLQDSDGIRFLYVWEE